LLQPHRARQPSGKGHAWALRVPGRGAEVLKIGLLTLKFAHPNVEGKGAENSLSESRPAAKRPTPAASGLRQASGVGLNCAGPSKCLYASNLALKGRSMRDRTVRQPANVLENGPYLYRDPGANPHRSSQVSTAAQKREDQTTMGGTVQWRGRRAL
jgi:hypothetical protein